MRRLCLTLGLVLGVGGAGAEPPDPGDRGDAQVVAFEEPPAIGKGRSFSQRIAEQLTLLGDSVNGHVGVLTLDAVKFRIDGPARRAHLRVAAGETRYLGLEIQSDIHFRGGAARVDARVDLMLAGRTMRFELPDFEVMPRSYLGERYVEVRIPFVRGTF